MSDFCVRRLGPKDEAPLEAFLDGLPRCHLYLRAAARRQGPEAFAAAAEDGRLVAVAHAGAPGSVVAAGKPAGIAALARDRSGAHDRSAARAPWRVLVGRDEETLAWLAADGTAKAVSRRHPYLVLDALPAGAAKGESVERATAGDFQALVRLALAFHRDDDPAGAAPRERKAVEARARARIAAGTSWVLRRDGVPVFMADVGAEEPSEGALLGGVVTDPAFRRRGIAREGLGALCRRLMSRGMPAVALHVAEENAAARRLYAGVGFREIDTFRVAWAT